MTCFHESCIYEFFSPNFLCYFLKGCKVVLFSKRKKLYWHDLKNSNLQGKLKSKQIKIGEKTFVDRNIYRNS